MYLKKHKQKLNNKEKTKTPLSQFVENCLNEKISSPFFSVKKPISFFTVSVHLNKNLFSKNKVKLLTFGFENTYNIHPKVYSAVYQKFNSYSILNNTQKQKLPFFSKDYSFFYFLTSTSEPDFLSLLNNQSLSKYTKIQGFQKVHVEDQTSIFLKKSTNLEKNWIFDIILLNNYWVEKSGVYSFRTNTGNYWVKNHVLFKNKTVFQSIYEAQTPSLNNKIVSIETFLKRQFALEAPFFLTFKNKLLKKSILEDFGVLLLEFYTIDFKKSHCSSRKFFFNTEKIFIKLQTFKFLLLLSIVPKYLSLTLLNKNELLFKFLNKNKSQILFFQVKHFLKSYQFFYLKQTIFNTFQYRLLNYKNLKFLNSFYCASNNQLQRSFFKLIKQGLSNQLNMFGLNLDFSILFTHETIQTLKRNFVVTSFKENLKTFTNINAFFFLKLLNLTTFQHFFRQKRLPTLNQNEISKEFQTKLLNLAFIRDPLIKTPALTEVEVFLFFLIKKGLFFGVYSKPQTSQLFSITLNSKKFVFLKLCFLLKQKSSLFLSQNTLKFFVLENQKKFVFCESLMIKNNNHLNFYMKNSINQKIFERFLILLNVWSQKNYFLYKPLPQIKYNGSNPCSTDNKNKEVNFHKIFKNGQNFTSFDKTSFYLNNYLVVFVSPHLYSVMPSEFHLFQHVNLIKKVLKFSAGQTQEFLILGLSQKIYAWCYFYRYIPQKYVFYSLNSLILKSLWRWACRRHNNKSKNWIKTKYFSKLNNKNWIFGNSFLTTEKNHFFYLNKVKYTRLTLFIYLPLYLQIYTHLKETSPKNFN